jgi:predicted nucleotidyltransferase
MSEATWEPKLARWSVGPGKTEEEKMDHAVTGIAGAIKASPVLGLQDIEILATGSYKNRTHIPVESDVDVAVIYKDVFFSNWYHADPRSATDQAVVKALMEEAGVTSATYHYAEYKNDVEKALVDRFGRAAVKRGDKAFDIHENTYRVESDCLAAFEYRLWQRNGAGVLFHSDGLQFISDAGKEIHNFPKQQFNNGQGKHDRTDRHFKKMVRIVKNLAVEMAEAGIAGAKPIPSFLIESLVYLVPDEYFGFSTFYTELRSVLAWLFNHTLPAEDCSKWTEENEIKFLFHDSQPWTKEQAHAFLSAAWDFVGLE